MRPAAAPERQAVHQRTGHADSEGDDPAAHAASKNIAFDIEHWILRQTELQRDSLFIWQKQTSKMMFGSYPDPGNIIENNTIEFINVYVKPGKPPNSLRG